MIAKEKDRTSAGRPQLSPAPGKRRGGKTARVLIGVVVLGIIVAAFALAGRFELRTAMDRVVFALREAGPAPFFAAMTVLPGVGFPLSAFLAVAGPVFGPTMGVGVVVTCAIAAITINVALSYWAAAWVLRPPILWLVQRLGYRLPDIPTGAAWPAILILRIVPGTPFFLQSLLLGLARVPFAAYMLVSTLVPAAYVTAIITLGDALMRGDWRAMAAAGALFLLAGGIIHHLRLRLSRRAAPADSSGD